MLYLYAFVPPLATVPDETGVDDRPVELVPVGDVAAVVGEVDGALDAEQEHVLAHARVVDALAAVNDAVLPVRFGRGFRDLAELEASIAPLAPALEERLAGVSGCVEIGVHVVGAPELAVRAGSGREYMQRRLRQVSHAEAVAEEIHAPLAEFAREASRSRGVAATALLRASYLVPRAEVESFRARVEDARRRHPDLTFACTGPWPPYSFAALEDEAA
jgi:hypothetical protein